MKFVILVYDRFGGKIYFETPLHEGTLPKKMTGGNLIYGAWTNKVLGIKKKITKDKKKVETTLYSGFVYEVYLWWICK